MNAAGKKKLKRKSQKTVADGFVAGSRAYSDLFGVYLASHAVPDSLCLMHAGVGCKTKGQQHLVNHDWFVEGVSRTVWSEVRDAEVVSGSLERLESAVRNWVARRNPSVVAVTTAAFLEVRGEDFASSLARVEREVGRPIMLLRTPGYEGDLFRGYASYVRALLEKMQWDDWNGRTDGRVVNVLGYVFDRYEMDHKASIAELTRLLEGMGLAPGRVLLSGTPFAQLRDAPRAGLHVVLPYLDPPPPQLGSAGVVRAHIPFGVLGTSRWMEAVGEAAGVKREVVRHLVEGEVRRVVQVLKHAAPRLQGLRAAVLADTVRAASVCGFLIELGMQPCVVCLTDRTLGGRKKFDELLARYEVSLAGDAKIVHDPAPAQLRSVVEEAWKEAGLSLLIGSSNEIADLEHLPVPAVEVGFPSYRRHCLYPAPELGFAGAVNFAQRILGALGRVH